MSFSTLAAPSQGYNYAELCRATYYLCWNYLIFCSTKLSIVRATERPTARGKQVKPGISKGWMTNSTWKFVYFCQLASFLAELEKKKLLKELLAWIENRYVKISF